MDDLTTKEKAAIRSDLERLVLVCPELVPHLAEFSGHSVVRKPQRSVLWWGLALGIITWAILV